MEQQYKADAGKPKVSLVPMQIVNDIAVIREYGVQKYKTVDNWKKVEIDRYVDALGRHTLAFLNDPLSVDEESGYPHLWHLECNAAFLSEMLKGAWERRTQEISARERRAQEIEAWVRADKDLAGMPKGPEGEPGVEE